MTTEERKLLEKWAPTGLLDNIRGKKKALLVARELDRHAQYALDHMSEHENWVDASLTPGTEWRGMGKSIFERKNKRNEAERVLRGGKRWVVRTGS